MQVIVPLSFVDTEDFDVPIKTVLDYQKVSVQLDTEFSSYLVEVVKTDTKLLDN